MWVNPPTCITFAAGLGAGSSSCAKAGEVVRATSTATVHPRNFFIVLTLSFPSREEESGRTLSRVTPSRCGGLGPHELFFRSGSPPTSGRPGAVVGHVHPAAGRLPHRVGRRARPRSWRG